MVELLSTARVGRGLPDGVKGADRDPLICAKLDMGAVAPGKLKGPGLGRFGAAVGAGRSDTGCSAV